MFIHRKRMDLAHLYVAGAYNLSPPRIAMLLALEVMWHDIDFN